MTRNELYLIFFPNLDTATKAVKSTNANLYLYYTRRTTWSKSANKPWTILCSCGLLTTIIRLVTKLFQRGRYNHIITFFFNIEQCWQQTIVRCYFNQPTTGCFLLCKLVVSYIHKTTLVRHLTFLAVLSRVTTRTKTLVTRSRDILFTFPVVLARIALAFINVYMRLS